MSHTVLTFITKVEPARVGELRALLKEIADNLLDNPYIPFPSLKLLHFASLVLSEDESYGPYLVFENNFDGPLDPYLADLYEHAADGLHRIYSCCLDYPARSASDREQIIAYLRSHVVRPNAYHVGNVGRTLKRIRQENELRDGLENYLDGLVREGRASEPPASIRKKVQDFVQGNTGYAWARQTGPRQSTMEYFIPRLNITLAAIIAFLLLPILIPVFIIWVIMLRMKEKSDPIPPNFGDQEHARKLVEREDRTHIVQNHMASITHVKPGAFRRVTLRIVLWLVNIVARTINDGKLSGIPSIHFAHWSMIDNGRRLLFVSNFDGSWENYLDDFIDKASTGLTAIWTNTVDFPKTSWLIFEGARDGARFKASGRDKMTYTNVWYSAYTDLTTQTIDNNSSIREDLFKPLDEAQTRTWLWRF
ncbi:MAG TPA: hypothetical protein VF553_16300 [Pyrinomonadaceae bacterium]|jgi:hypothetical protein